LYNRLKPIKSKENEGKMGVVNLHRKEGGHFEPELGGQYHRILQLGTESKFPGFRFVITPSFLLLYLQTDRFAHA
jgi:hypothetical protein